MHAHSSRLTVRTHPTSSWHVRRLTIAGWLPIQRWAAPFAPDTCVEHPLMSCLGLDEDAVIWQSPHRRYPHGARLFSLPGPNAAPDPAKPSRVANTRENPAGATRHVQRCQCYAMHKLFPSVSCCIYTCSCCCNPTVTHMHAWSPTTYVITPPRNCAPSRNVWSIRDTLSPSSYTDA